jgi:hypothetical protein
MLETSMRRALALLLLVCFGITLPTAASPLRLCLHEDNLVSAVLAPLQSGGEPDAPCCPRCPRKDSVSDSCCLVVEELPDYTGPRLEFHLPPLKISEIPVWTVTQCVEISPVLPDSFRVSGKVPGPPPSLVHLSKLSVWRL